MDFLDTAYFPSRGLMLDAMSDEEPKIRGVVSEVGLERDEDHFRSFNLKIGVVLKAGKSLTYKEGEQQMRRFRKELLGKEVEVSAILFKCPTCGRGFNTEQGMKQHVRMTHKKTKKKRKKRKTSKKKKTGKSSKSKKADGK